MQSLGSYVDREEILGRIAALTAADQRRWGKMTARQMVCHLCDSYKLALGEKSASPATGFLQRTVMGASGLALLASVFRFPSKNRVWDTTWNARVKLHKARRTI